MIYIVLFFRGFYFLHYKSLCCKILFPYRFANFSDVVSNYLITNHHIHSWFSAKCPCMLIQYIDNDENVIIIFIELCVRAHLDYISLIQIIISLNYDRSVENFFSPERSVLPPIAIFRDFSFQTCYVTL